MFLKPDSCKPCPLYNLSKHITPDKTVENSTISIIAQAPGKHEEEGNKIEYYSYGKENIVKVRPQPLIGASGFQLRNTFWPLTKLDFNSVSLHNIIKCRPNNINDLPSISANKTVNGITVTMLKEAIKHCTNKYLKIPEKTETILAMGEVSFYALTGDKVLNYRKHEKDESGEGKKSTATEWRGSVLGLDLIDKDILGLHDYYDCSLAGSSLYSRMVNVFPIVHLASLHKNEKYYHSTLHDFVRFGKLIRKEWPIDLPDIKVNVLPTNIPNLIGFDTEYDVKDNNSLIMWSLADASRNVYAVDARYSSKLLHMPDKVTVITQNGLVDMPYFVSLLPSDYEGKIKLEDCMLAHAARWTGELNSLDYMLSKYGKYNRHKHLRLSEDKEVKYLYAGLDADTTLNHVWLGGLIPEFKRDHEAWIEYQERRQPLLKIINRFQQKGIKVDQRRVDLLKSILDQEIERIEKEAQEITGNPDFNIRSHTQVGNILFHNNYETKKKVVKPRLKKKYKESILLEQLKLQYGD